MSFTTGLLDAKGVQAKSPLAGLAFPAEQMVRNRPVVGEDAHVEHVRLHQSREPWTTVTMVLTVFTTHTPCKY